MFASGSSRMPETTRKLLAKITQVVQKLPNKISLSGHTDATPFRGSRSGYGNWELSANRALASRRVMVESGLKIEKISHVTGKEATEPLIKDDPKDARNRRISIVVLREAGKESKAPPAKDAPEARAPAPVGPAPDPSFQRDWSGPRLR